MQVKHLLTKLTINLYLEVETFGDSEIYWKEASDRWYVNVELCNNSFKSIINSGAACNFWPRNSALQLIVLILNKHAAIKT